MAVLLGYIKSTLQLHSRSWVAIEAASFEDG